MVADPELRFLPTGVPVANFRVASTPRRWDANAGQMVDGDPVFLTCNAWRGMAENVAESLQKGMRVVVTGVLRQRSYETREGEKRTVFEVDVEDVGPSLKWATARVERNVRDSGASGGRFAGSGNAGGSNSPRGGYGAAGGPSGYANGGAGAGGGAAGGGLGSGYDDEPPF